MKRDERRLVVLMFCLSFLVMGIDEIFITAVGESSFIATFGSESLAYTYLAAAVALPIIGYVLTRAQARVPYMPLLVAALLFDAVVLLGLRLGLELGQPWVSFVAATWVEVEFALSSVVFWGLANRIFDVRQSKRYFGRIGAGQLAALSLGGLLTPLLVRLMGTANLLLISAASVLCGAALLFLIVRDYAPRLMTEVSTEEDAEEDDDERAAAEAAVDALAQRGYTRLVIALGALALGSYYVIDNAFYIAASARYPSEEQLAGFVGVFMAFASLASLAGRFFLTGWLFRRYGLRLGLVILPVVLFLCTVPLAASNLGFAAAAFVFWLATMNKFIDRSATDSVNSIAVLMLYQPLPASLRSRLQMLVESVVEPVIGGVMGVLMIVAMHTIGLSAAGIAVAELPLLVGWIMVALRLRRAYVGQLEAAVRTRRIGGRGLDANDETAGAVLRTMLASGNVGDVTYAVDILVNARADDLVALLTPLLAAEDPRVRRHVALAVEVAHRAAFVPALRARLAEEREPVVCAALARAIAATDGGAVNALEPLLADPASEVRRDAMVGLFKHGGIEGVLAAGDTFLTAARAADPAERQLAAGVIEEVGNPQFYRSLLPLLEDPEPQVREAALEAAARVDVPAVRERVLANVDGSVSSAVRRASRTLALFGDVVIPDLEHLFARDDVALPIRVRVLQILGQIHTPQANAALVQLISGAHTSEIVRMAGVRALVRNDYHVDGDGDGAEAMWAMLRGEAAQAAWTCAALRDLEPDERSVLVVESLVRKLPRHRERIFGILSFVGNTRALRSAWAHFRHDEGEKRAYALEVVENAAPLEIRQRIVPLLEAISPAECLHALGRVHPEPHCDPVERLRDVAARAPGWMSPWTQACALEALARHGDRGAVEVCDRLARTEHGIVRETAQYALRLLNGAARGSTDGAALVQTILEKMFFLRSVPLFEAVPEDLLLEIAHAAAVVEVKAGAPVYQQGDFGDALYVIARGRVALHLGDREIATLGEHDVFGELSALDPTLRSTSARALDDVTLYKVDNKELDDVVSADVTVTRNIIRILARRLRAANEAGFAKVAMSISAIDG